MKIKDISTGDLKEIRDNTISFVELKEVENELLKRKAIRKSSFEFFDKIKVKIEC